MSAQLARPEQFERDLEMVHLAHARAERGQAIDALYTSVMNRLAIGPAHFSTLLAGWDVFPIHDQGEIIGALVRRDNELHLGVRRQPRAASTHRTLRAVLADTIANFGFASTQVDKTNPGGLAFCHRLGFWQFDENATTWYLRCDTPRHRAKGAP